MSAAHLRIIQEPTTDAPAAPGAPAGSIPIAATALVGRDDLVTAVADQLLVAPLVTLLGIGGIGKTRTALAVAHRLSHHQIVRWVDLTSAATAMDVLGSVATSLHLAPRVGQLLHEAISVACQTTPQVLILDNCEPVVAAVADFVAELQRAAPATRLLCTSREPIGVPGEVTWPVPPLAIAAAGEAAQESSAVTLFLARAREANPRLRVNDETMRAVVDICAALDGVPLALELAAARVRALSPVQLRSRLHDAMRILRGGPRTAPARHRTMEDALAWTWEQLTPAEQAVAAAASVFVGGWSLDAFEAVGQTALDAVPDGATEDALDVLARLVDKSLVSVDEAGDDVRYRMLEPVRQYAAARLAAEPWRDAAAAAHRTSLANFVAHAAGQMERADHDVWRARVTPELASIRAAIEWWCRTPGEAEQAAHLLGDSVCVLLDVTDWSANAQLCITVMDALARDGVSTATAENDEELRAWVRAAIATQYFGYFAASADGAALQTMARDTVAAARRLDDPRLLLGALDVGARALVATHTDEAISFVTELLDRLDTVPPGWLRGAVGIAAASYCWRLLPQDLDRGERYARESEQMLRDCGAFSTMAYARGERAAIAVRRQAWAEASRLASTTLADSAGQPTLFVANAFNVLASAAAARGDHALAARLHGAARGVLARCGLASRDDPDAAALYESLRQALGTNVADAALADAAALPMEAMLSLAGLVPNETAEFPAVRISGTRARGATDTNVPPLTLQLLGPIRLHQRDTASDDGAWPYAKPRELCALLGCHPDGCTKDAIGLALWPDLSPTQLRNNLHVTLHHARRALGDAALIEHARGRYRIAVERGLVVDVQVFRAASREARSGATAEVRRAARTEALAWWRGDFCTDEQFGMWADDQRDQLRADYLPLLLAHAEDQLEAEQASEALAAFQRALQEDPFWDAALRGVVRSLLALGQRGEAQLRVQRYRERHVAELGGDVAEETKRFLASVLGLGH